MQSSAPMQEWDISAFSQHSEAKRFKSGSGADWLEQTDCSYGSHD